MRSTPRRIALHVVLLVVVLVVLSAIAIWLGLGPVVHSRVGPGGVLKRAGATATVP